MNAAKPDTAAAPPLRNSKGELTKAGFEAAWDAVYMTLQSVNEPASKKLAAFEASVGKPFKVDGEDKFWWLFDQEDCYQARLDDVGTKTLVKVPPEKCKK